MSTVAVVASLLVAARVVAAPAGPGTGAASGNDKPAKAKPATTAKPSTGAPSNAPAAAPMNAGPGGPGGSAGPDGSAPSPEASSDLATVKPEDMPTAVRMRRLEQRTQALKERSWQLKARVQMLKEQVLGGGVGAQAVIAHANEMGAAFRLTKLIYSLDGAQVFVRTDDTAENLYKTKGFDVFAGPISPGNHNLAAVATYRGHGYGVFEYLSKYTFTAKGTQGFVAGEGRIAKIDCRGFEKGGPTTPLEKRAAIECRVAQVQPEHPPDKEDRSASPASPAPASSAPANPAPANPAPANPAPANPAPANPAAPTPPAPSGK
jgi:hypothetical protein